MKTLKNSMIVALLLLATTTFSQTEELEFDVYAASATNASQYLLADDVSLRDCPAAQCEQLTTITIGTIVRLLAKSDSQQVINGVCRRWYKITMGPQVGWIWGGLIAQKTMISKADPEVKLMIGESGLDAQSNKKYQIRAVKNGVELDRMVFISNSLDYTQIRLKSDLNTGDVIQLVTLGKNNVQDMRYVVWNGTNLQYESLLTEARQHQKTP
jgi:hypothetical protein